MNKQFLIRKPNGFFFVTSNCEIDDDCVADFYDTGFSIECSLHLNEWWEAVIEKACAEGETALWNGTEWYSSLTGEPIKALNVH